MGKQIQIVGANNAPYVAKELDLESGNQFMFAKPDGTDVVEVGALDFIKAVEEYDTFKDWVVNYKRDENTIIPLRIDKIEGNVDTEKIVYTFTNDDVDVSSITLVKLIVEMVNATNEISASYVDETKEIEAGTVLPTPSADDNGKVLGVEDGAYALVDNPIPAVETTDKDKYLHTNSETGALEWSAVQGGGSLPIAVIEKDVLQTTFQDMFTAIGMEYPTTGAGTGEATILFSTEYDDIPTQSIIAKLNFSWGYYGQYCTLFYLKPKSEEVFEIEVGVDGATEEQMLGTTMDLVGQTVGSRNDYPFLPPLPSNASSKTLTLKAVNGVLDWVE